MPTDAMPAAPGFRLPVSHKLEPQYQRHYSLFATSPSPATGGALLGALKPVIDKGITSFGGKNVNPMLKSHAKKLALDAVRTYDPATGPLGPHVMNSLQGLKRYSVRQQQVLSVPDGVATDHKRLADAHRELTDDLGREPSDSELADHTGLSVKRMGYVRGYKPGFTSSQAQSVGEDGGAEDAGVSAPDTTIQKIHFLYPDLDPVNQVIAESHFGLHGKPKRSFTATARALNLSNGAISQRVAHMQRMLDELDDAKLF